MNDEYKNWIEARRASPVSPDFTDRVMEEVRAPDVIELSTWQRLEGMRWLRVAIGALALAVGVARFLYLAVLVNLI